VLRSGEHADAKLLRGDKRLTDCGVRADSTVVVSSLLRGGALPCAAEDSRSPATFCEFETEVIRQWGKGTGNSWYRAKPGLCLEGICNNPKCPAFQKWVIVNWRYNDFDLQVDGNDSRLVCPSCHEWVAPTACGFNNCLWRYSGMKSGRGEQVSCRWKAAGDQYHSFNPVTGDTQCKWKRLLIEVRSPENIDAMGTVCSISRECAICYDDLAPPQRTRVSGCRHDFHERCIRKWLEGKPTCPVCRRTCALASHTLAVA
jgi:hypothetical protein